MRVGKTEPESRETSRSGTLILILSQHIMRRYGRRLLLIA